MVRQNVLALVYDVALFYERKQKAPQTKKTSASVVHHHKN